jgi:hypothetical protein
MAKDPVKPVFNKLAALAQDIPDGLVLPREWLIQQGFTDDNLKGYVRAGYLIRVARALYAKPQAGRLWSAADVEHAQSSRPAGAPAWKVALNSALLTEPVPLAVAGYSALEIRNLAHFSSDKTSTEVWVTGPQKIPTWMAQMASVQWRLLPASKLFNDRPATPPPEALYRYDSRDLAALLEGSGFEAIGRDTDSAWLIASTPERALLEWANNLATEADWRHFYEVMEGMPSLRPKPLMSLLKTCTSIKAKRTFLWMGKSVDASWYRAIKRDMSDIDLGKGKRQLIPGGMLDAEYQITVPRGISDGV